MPTATDPVTPTRPARSFATASVSRAGAAALVDAALAAAADLGLEAAVAVAVDKA